ncbi:S-adenosyl-L-methionine-dependent methyltransferase [Microthyrium microscopicum]|uniref:S-adenosyl-L-methionine-dependent methyltransferase n=1 Tax=Microthyrium microscopicum TaxID=703497 RepID=A0A6A6UCV2_9PEZI|nr:S-adenosyl-L-methionine-dependent methyltransferase [Microthyrium microscopicum]
MADASASGSGSGPSAATTALPTTTTQDDIATTHHAGPLEADNDNPDDEGYQESSTSSLLSSIASEIRQGHIENGRMYANYGKHEYLLPIDDEELDRLDLNHTKYYLLMQNKHFLAPLPEDPQNALDIGCGTGIWAIDFADKYPSCSVIGTDIAPVQPQWVPPNCNFQIDDAELDWTFQENHFDYIHLRDLYQAIRDWPKLVSQAFTHVKPGGYVEFCAIHPQPATDDNTLDPTSAYMQLADVWEKAGALINCEPDSAKRFKQWFVEAGFEAVEEYVLKVPSSPWPKDPRMKRIGAYELMNVLEGARGFMMRGWTKECGLTLEELEMAIMRLKKELPSNKMHSYIPFYVVIGRKPASSQS